MSNKNLGEIESLSNEISVLWNQITEDIYSLEEIEDFLTFEIILGVHYALGVIKGDCVLNDEGIEILKAVRTQLLTINDGISE